MSQKNAYKYECNSCDFKSGNKCDYIRHLSTRKHVIRTNENKLEQENAPHNKYLICNNCGKTYKARSGLWNHQKKCHSKKLINEAESSDSEIDYKEMFLEMLTQNKELQNTIIEQNKVFQNTIVEIIPKVGNNTSNSHNTNTSNINIVMNNINFLNEKCKDALTLKDFIKSIVIEVKDLEFTGKKGFVEGVSNLFLENYIKLPIQMRPIWCGDKKRKKIYIKEDEWQEDKEQKKTKEAIKDLSVKQAQDTNKYAKKYPGWMSDDKKKDTYIGIISQTTSDINEKMDKIVSNIVDKTHLSDDSKDELKYITE